MEDSFSVGDGIVLGGGGGVGGGYLSGEDGRCSGGVLIGDEGGVHVDGVGRADSGQDSVSLETVEDSFSGGNSGGG